MKKWVWARDVGKIYITLSPLVKIRPWMWQRESAIFQLLLNIISSSFLLSCHHYSFLLALHLHPYSFLFFLFHGLICLLVSLCQSLSRFHPPLISPFCPPSEEWIQVSQFYLGHASCLQQSIRENGLLSSSRAFSFGQLLCPNPEITFGWSWKGRCVSVIPNHLFTQLTPLYSGNGLVWLKPRLT